MILVHEWAHLTLNTISWWNHGESVAYPHEWFSKGQMGWTRDKYGEPRKPQTPQWRDVKYYIRKYALSMLTCDQAVEYPADRCLPCILA